MEGDFDGTAVSIAGFLDGRTVDADTNRTGRQAKLQMLSLSRPSLLALANSREAFPGPISMGRGCDRSLGRR
jgi:hypothetical protein